MSVRRFAYNAVCEVMNDGAYTNLAVKKQLSQAPQKDRGRLAALVYNTVENRGYCDFLVDAYSKGRVRPQIRCILCMGIAEKLYMDTTDHAICNESVSLTKEIGKAAMCGVVNGVLRSVFRDIESGNLPELPDKPEARLGILYGCPPSIVKEYLSEYGEEFTEGFLSEKQRYITVRSVSPYTTEELVAALNDRDAVFEMGGIVKDAVKAANWGSNIVDDVLFRSGRITVQSESAMLVCRCLSPKNGMTVLDSCAAPGGKTAYISELMDGMGEITAWDIHAHRTELIRKTLERLHIKNVKVEVHDAAVHRTELDASFDAVLCDVPCSGLGGSKPDAMYNKTDEDIDSLAKLQYDILSTCSKYVRIGGVVVYSTCTVSKRENIDVVNSFLSKNPEFCADDITEYLPGYLAGRVRRGTIQLFPHIDKTDGFFIARMVRVK